MKACDRDIRLGLKEILLDKFKYEPDTKIINELGICQGKAIIDVAVVNGALHGYEIKSERDTLGRLTGQLQVYGKVFDTLTIVTGPRYIDRVQELIPDWWGVLQVEEQSGKVIFKTVREAHFNPCIEPFALVQLLWRDEALSLLKELGLAEGYSKKPRKEIWERLANSLPLQDLRFYVRQQLKSRRKWRSG